MTHPTDGLVRAVYDVEAATLRADTDDGDGRTLHGHFARYNSWTEINSWFEGRFMERIADGAFDDAIRDHTTGARPVKILYDHGRDPSIGNKPLGAPDVLRSDKGVGPYYESSLFDASYVNDLIPALRAGQLGASFRFGITAEEWIEPKRATNHNPEKLPERTITGVRLHEFGPVTFPAYADATAGVRSGTDEFLDSLIDDPRFLARFTERAGLNVVEKILAQLPLDERKRAASTCTDGDGTASWTSALLAVEQARMALL